MDEEPPKMKITVSALWDAEARVWVATSEDVPGLATEAPTVEALRAKIETMIPELLELCVDCGDVFATTPQVPRTGGEQ